MGGSAPVAMVLNGEESMFWRTGLWVSTLRESNMNPLWIPMGLTVFAGMATGIGSIIAFTAKRTNYRFLSVATGFSAS